MKEKFQKLNNWYVRLNKKQRIIIWTLSLLSIFILAIGIPLTLILLYMEFHRGGDKNNYEEK